MKMLFAIVALLSFSQAQAWTAIQRCENSEVVIDQGGNDEMGRPTYQLVLRGPVVKYFVEKGVMLPRDVSANGEYVGRLMPYDSEMFVMVRAFGPMGQPFQYSEIWVQGRRTGDIRLVATLGNHLTGRREIANWQFHGCR